MLPNFQRWESPPNRGRFSSPASAATVARTSACSRFRASAATSAPAATPSAWRSGCSGWTRCSSRPCRTDTWCSRSPSGCARTVSLAVACSARSPASPPAPRPSPDRSARPRGRHRRVPADAWIAGHWHPHPHLLMTEGGVEPDRTFVSWPMHDTLPDCRASRAPRPSADAPTAPWVWLPADSPRPRRDIRRARPSLGGVIEGPARPSSRARPLGRTAREAHRRGGGRAVARSPVLARRRNGT